MRFLTSSIIHPAGAALILALGCGGSSAPSNPPAITTPPANAAIKAGASVSFTVACTSDPSPTFAWERSNDAGTGWSTINGANSATYTFNAVLADDGAQFRAKVTNSHGSTLSAAATLAVDFTNILVGGYYSTGSKSGVGYWKNEDWIDLPMVAKGVTSMIYSIQVVGSDVYMAGSQHPADYSNHYPGYWKNGQWVGLSLPDPGLSAASNDLLVSGADVYVGGSLWNAPKRGFLPGYWKNGNWTQLTDGNVENGVNSLLMSGTDLYAITDNGYWKNGTWTVTPGAGTLSKGTVAGSDIYIPGSTKENTQSTPGYLKNGVWVSLPLPTGAASAFGQQVVIDKGDVYVLGVAVYGEGTKVVPRLAGYWKNGTWVPLPTANPDFVSSYAYSLNVHRGEVYVGGYCMFSDGTPNIGYWEKGVWKDLAAPAFSVKASSFALGLQ